MAQIEYNVLQYPEGITRKTEKEWNQSGKDGWDSCLSVRPLLMSQAQ